MKQSEMFRAEFINQQLSQIERQLQDLDEKEADLLSLKHAVTDFSAVPEGKELRVPLARGIFVPAKSTGKQGFFVNVGQGVVVEKSKDDLTVMLERQLTELSQYREELQRAFEKGLKALQDLEQEHA